MPTHRGSSDQVGDYGFAAAEKDGVPRWPAAAGQRPRVAVMHGWGISVVLLRMTIRRRRPSCTVGRRIGRR